MGRLFVVNSRGEKEPFSFQKICRAAQKAGAPARVSREIARSIEGEVYPLITTLEISEMMRKLLQKEHPGAALRFNIKEAMRRLGPTGFPFEKYAAEVLKSLGYRTKINQFIPGKCLGSYEIDFVAEKGNIIYIGECKYRNLFGERVDSPDALENYARFLDILNGPHFKSKKYRNFIIKTMMVTNTKFNERVVAYANCVGMELLGWHYPRGRGLEYLIEKEKLYPITILPALKGYLKEIFTQEKLMLAKDVLRIDSERFARKFKISPAYLKPLINQAEILLKE